MTLSKATPPVMCLEEFTEHLVQQVGIYFKEKQLAI